MVTLKLFGGAVIEGPAGPLSGRITQRRRLALLACLAASRGRPVSRDKLMALFWPDAGGERARHLLSDSVYLIRRELGESAIATAGNDLRLDPAAVACDVVAFEQAITEGRLEAATDLYAGPFLDGFHIEGAPEFEHWLDAERDRLARSCARSLEALAEEREAAGDFAGASEYWRRLAAHEPASGRVALRVIQALDAAGDRAGAIRHARTHATLLTEQFGIDPDPAVIEFADGLRTGAVPRRTLGGTPGPSSEPTEPAAERTLAPVSPRGPANAGTAGAAGDEALAGAALPPARRAPKRRVPAAVLVVLVGTAAVVAIGSLVARRASRDMIIVTDVARDTVLGDFVSERLREVLARSPRLGVLGRPAIQAALQRMGRSPATRLVPEVTRELAVREGIKAFVRVDILTSGDAHYLSAALVSAQNGELLDSDGVIARNATEVVSATDQLMERVRGRFPRLIGSVENRDRLYPVTTDSIRALLEHMEGFLAFRLHGDVLRAIERTERALAIDPSFAQAYLQLSWYLDANGTHVRRADWAVSEAYRLRDRLSPYERSLVEGEYLSRIDGDLGRAVDRYRDHIVEAKKFGRNQVIVNYLALAHVQVMLGDLDAAERTLQESRHWFPGPFNQAFLVRLLYSLGRDAEAKEVLAEATAAFPENAWPAIAGAHLAAVSGDYARAHALAMDIDAPDELPFALRTVALFDAVQGRLAEAGTHLGDLQTRLLEEGLSEAAINVAAAAADLRLIAGDTLGAVAAMETLLARQPADSVGALGQPAVRVARFFARANRPRRAAELLAAYENSLTDALAKVEPWLLHVTRAEIALADGDPAAALAALRPRTLRTHRNEWFEDVLLPLESRPERARAWDRAGQPDSAIAVYERYVGAHALFRAELDAFELARAYRRLAALYEDRGDFARAAGWHRRLAGLWRDADPPLRQQASAALRRADSLAIGMNAVR